MGTATLLIIIGAIVVILGLIIFALAKQYKKVGPNEVLIVSGGRKRTVQTMDGDTRQIGYRLHIGGGTFVMPFIESAQVLPLETYTVTIKTPEVLTRQGVHIIAEASAQVKIASSEAAIRRAAEQFLGRGGAGIKEAAGHILEGYVRSALGGMEVEDIYQNRDDFAREVRKEAEADMKRMGLELLSFNLKDISDTGDYINSLGLPRIAQVKRDAAIAQAEAEKDTVIQSSQARKEGDVVRYQVETEIAAANKEFELKRSEFQLEINQKKAQADVAYDLERHKQSAQLKKAEFDTRIIEKESSIKLEQQEIKRRELELEASVKKPAEARRFQIETEAEAEKFRLASEAQGRADARRAEGEAEISIKKGEGVSRIAYTRELGKAEAEAMAAKAESFRGYNDAAMAQMIIDKMPEIARAVSEPLTKIDKITLIGNDGTTGASKITQQVADVIGQVPSVIESLTGVDVTQYLKKEKGKETA